MIYKVKVAVCSEIHKNIQRKVSTVQNFLMENLVVHKETARF
jgi:hypothetical protein